MPAGLPSPPPGFRLIRLYYLTLTSNPPPRSYCHAVSQGLFESPLGWSQHTYAHVMKAAFRKANSDSAVVSRRDKPHSCSFHDTARFLFKKYIGYVNRHY